MPIVLWIMRKLHLRSHDSPPRAFGIVVPLLFWSFVFEIWLPQLHLPGTPFVSDANDIFYYALGALVAALGWRTIYASHSDTSQAMIK